MNKLKAGVIAAMLLAAGCGTPQHPSNQQLIDETKRCEQAGMRAEAIRYVDNGVIAIIQCVTNDYKMTRAILAWAFQIHIVTPFKLLWVALTLANVTMMLWLAWRERSAFTGYFMISAVCVLLQGSPLWGMYGELFWAGAAAWWVWSMLPRDTRGRIFALSLGLMLSSLMMMLGLIPWPHYDHAIYFTRMYSSLAFGSISAGSAVIMWADALRIEWGTIIAVAWFGAVLFGGTELTWYYWTHQMVTTAIWTACLITWLAISFRPAQGVSSGRPSLPAGTGI